jgi:hypothetical protein
MQKTGIPLSLLLAMLMSCIASGADVQTLELAAPFLNQAILQREMSVPVWGWAKPGSTVTVSFAGQKKTAISDATKKWRLKLDPLKASLEGREMSVTASDGESLTLKDVLVGEVWFSSGQSNMDWIAGKSMCRDLANTLRRSTEEFPIREYAADSGSALFLRNRVSSEGGWKSSRHAGEFSALSLAFAWELYQELKVPIGIMRSTHGATPIEPWTAFEGYASHPKLQPIAAKIRRSDPTTPDGQVAYANFYDELRDWQKESEKIINKGGVALPRPKLPGIGDEWKGATRMYNFKIAPLVPYAIRGAIWCQGTHSASDGKIYAAKMEALVNGWRENWRQGDFPFYFTQMQCYGEPNPESVGFADIREAQTMFFMNAKNVGMVLQYDLNPARPTGIHYYNKLDPGKRLARWALANDYGKQIAYSGPVYKSHSITGNEVHVRFEQRGPGGGLMVASKGMEADYQKNPASYVEPARETKGEKLKHFRLAGKDRVWHAADAVIHGHEVVVTSMAVPQPVGVQYAYSGSPIGANLYNAAGLPATPFAYFDGKQLFNEDDPVIVDAARMEAERKWGKKTYLLVSSLFRDHAVIQRNLPVPVWGHGIPGTEITVVFGDQSKKTVVGEYEKWLVKLEPMPAASQGRDLKIICSDGVNKTIKDIVVGDVWIMTGARSLPSEIIKEEQGDKVPLKSLPLVREFRIKTKARRFATPRKLRLEIGGGKYVASWKTVDFDRAEQAPSVLAYHFAANVQEPNVPVGIVTLGSENPPLTWVSYSSIQTAAGFEKERDELNLLYPNTDSGKAAVSKYIQTVMQYNSDVAAMLEAGKELPSELAEQAPSFPQPYYNQWVSRTETATHTYNFCISPLTPFAIRGVVWIPDKDNINDDASHYAAALSAYANSLAATYGQDKVAFIYAQPTAKLVDGIVRPQIKNAIGIEFDEWPTSLKDIAIELGAVAAEK